MMKQEKFLSYIRVNALSAKLMSQPRQVHSGYSLPW